MSTTTALEPKTTAAVTGAPLLVAGVNLLPPEIAERARFRRLQMALAGGLLLTVGAVGLGHASAVGSVRDAGEALTATQARTTALRADTAELADVQDVYDAAEAARATLATAMGSEVRFSSFLHDLSRTVPDDVWLKGVSFTQSDGSSAGAAGTAPAGTGPGSAGIGTVTFTGVGFRHDDVATWLESLSTQRGYGDASFSNSTEALIGSRRTVSFTSTATLTPDALSGRYTLTDGS